MTGCIDRDDCDDWEPETRPDRTEFIEDEAYRFIVDEDNNDAWVLSDACIDLEDAT